MSANHPQNPEICDLIGRRENQRVCLRILTGYADISRREKHNHTSAYKYKRKTEDQVSRLESEGMRREFGILETGQMADFDSARGGALSQGTELALAS